LQEDEGNISMGRNTPYLDESQRRITSNMMREDRDGAGVGDGDIPGPDENLTDQKQGM